MDVEPPPRGSLQQQQGEGQGATAPTGPPMFGASGAGRYYPAPPGADEQATISGAVPGGSVLAAISKDPAGHRPPPPPAQRRSFPRAERVVDRAVSPRRLDPRLGIGAARSSAEASLDELMRLQRRRHYDAGDIGEPDRLRMQAVDVLGDLRVLRAEVSGIVSEAESHRWRKWLLGGIVASLIPAVRAIWRRPSDDVESSNDTEYAFKKSKSLIRRILNSVQGFGKLASFTFFIFAVVYVFQNEVYLRVAKTVSKRLKRLSLKVERDEEKVDEADIRLLMGWRWRVLLWNHGGL